MRTAPGLENKGVLWKMNFLNSLKPYLHFCSHINHWEAQSPLGSFGGSQGEGAGSLPWTEQELSLCGSFLPLLWGQLGQERKQVLSLLGHNLRMTQCSSFFKLS